MRTVTLLATTIAISIVSVLVLARFAPALGLIDTPGGRKMHPNSVPLVGGLGIFIAVSSAAWLFGLMPALNYYLFALAIVIAAGLWDDLTEISPRLKVMIQIIAAAVMIWGAGVQLHSVGDLIGWRSVGLKYFAIPLTIFAVIGVVNAVNMMDGLDGLAGSVALVAFGWFAVVAAQSGFDEKAMASLLMCSAVAGFLALNLRLPWQGHARVFLGDAGSLMLGFALGWHAIDLTQGPGRTFPPIAAVWILMLPLVDCVSLMIRRLHVGRNPFSADRLHLHHLLLARGFTASQTLAIMVGASVLLGAVGYFAWIFRASEAALFYPFFFGFFAYHAWIQGEWKKILRPDAVIPAEITQDKQNPTQTA